MLDLHRLRTFREVMRRRSFSAAAHALDYTQSSVSQQISTLERELGATLIDRAIRPVTATALGEVVLRRADALLGQAAAVEEEIAALRRGEAGFLRVGGFHTAWATFMPTAVADVSRSRPGVQIRLRQLEPELARQAVAAGELDVAVVYRFDAGDDGDRHLAQTHLLDDPYEIALGADHPLAPRVRVSLDALATERWVSPPPGEPYTRDLLRLCREHGGFEPDVAYETSDVALVQPLVAAGLAVALLPALALVPSHAGVVVKPVVPASLARSVWAIRRARDDARAADAMIAALARAAATFAAPTA